jgi:hypothetical protein
MTSNTTTTVPTTESNSNQVDNHQQHNSSSTGLITEEMLADEDPLLISQSLTYVTDDGGTLHSFHSAPFSTGMFSLFLSLNE